MQASAVCASPGAEADSIIPVYSLPPSTRATDLGRWTLATGAELDPNCIFAGDRLRTAATWTRMGVSTQNAVDNQHLHVAARLHIVASRNASRILPKSSHFQPTTPGGGRIKATNLGRTLRTSTNFEPRSAEIGTSTELGQVWPETGQVCADRHRPMLAKARPTLTQFGRHRLILDGMRTTSTTLGLESAKSGIWAELGQAWGDFGRRVAAGLRPNLWLGPAQIASS